MSTLKQYFSYKSYIRGLCALALVLSCAGVFLAVRTAIAGDESAYLEIGSSIYYDQYSTNWMWADGNMAYCGNPSLGTPSSGVYSKSSLDPKDPDRYFELRADLWYGWGGPGFDESMWPGTWFDGSPMDGGKYASLTHIILSDTYWSDGNAAQYGCTAAFRSWVRTNILGFDEAGNEINVDATGRQMAYARDSVPSEEEFATFVLHTGGFTQNILSFSYEPHLAGYLDLEKTSDNPSFTDGNSNYRLDGAEYGVYSDSTCSDLVEKLITNGTGYAKSSELACGTYYVKEIKPSPGYNLDTTTYQALVEKDMTTRVNNSKVKEPVKDGRIEIIKSSNNPTMTEDNACYSLKGAVYGVYSNSSCTVEVDRITTEENGKGASKKLALGSYWVKEIEASPGYAKDTTSYPVNIAHTSVETVTYTCNVLETPKGDPIDILVQKLDTETGKASPQGKGELAGAQFEVKYYAGFYDTSVKNWISTTQATRTWVLETDSDGKAYLHNDYKKSGDEFYYNSSGLPSIPLGTITVVEKVAPKGYLLSDPTIYAQQVTDDGSELAEIHVLNKKEISDNIIRGGIKLEKHDNLLGSTPQGEADFSGIKFAIVSDNNNIVLVDGSSYSKGETVKTITTNTSGFATTANDTLPYGDYTVYELDTNGSYLNTSQAKKIEVRENGVIIDCVDSNSFADEVVRGGVSILKLDLETNLNTPLGAASVDGAQFEITSLNPNPVVVDGVTYYYNSVVKRITTENGVAKTGSNTLPYGSYSIKEMVAPEGYLISDKVQYFSVRVQGEIVALTSTNAIANQVIRGDLEFLKIENGTMKRMSFIPFEIKSNTTGEAHVVVTDANGQASTASSWNLHSANTNRGLTDEDGVWFGLAHDGSIAPVDDRLGALPYDNYTITELPCAENEGKVLHTFSVTVKRNSTTVNLGTLTNDDIRKLQIIKVDAATQQPLPGATLRLIRLSDNQVIDEWITTDQDYLIDDVEPGDYELLEIAAADGYALPQEALRFTVYESAPLTKVVMENDFTKIRVMKRDADTGNPLSGAVLQIANDEGIVIEEWISTEEYYEVRGLKPGTYTLIETEAPPTHQKPETESQQFIVDHQGLIDGRSTFEITLYNKPITIKTTALEADTNTHYALSDDSVSIVDSIHYSGLTPEKEYTAIGTLIDKSSGMPLLFEQQAITSSEFFTPEVSDGTIEVTFNFDGTSLAGATVVVFEEIFYEDTLVVAHADINDTEQSITFLDLKTTATNPLNNTSFVQAASLVSIVDTVSYHGLTPNQEYTLNGILMDRLTGEPLLVDNQKVSSKTTFTPTTPEGSAEVIFEFNGLGLGGKSCVVFERLYLNENEIGSHTDLDDENQTIFFIDLETKAINEESGMQETEASGTITIVDTIKYTGLMTGSTYQVSGILMNKATGMPLVAEETPITSSATFTAHQPNGIVQVSFTFDSTGLEDSELVVFETLLADEKIIATHADFEDKNQTIRLLRIETTARAKINSTHYTEAAERVILTDAVYYKGLTPHSKYIITGKLMNKATGEALLVAGKEINSSATFIPEESTGMIELEFELDARGLENTSTVIFETLYQGDSEIASHTDIDDERQTIHFMKIGTTATALSSNAHDAIISKSETIVDTVEYAGLNPGAEYSLMGVLMNKSTGTALNIDGEPVYGYTTFVAEESVGTAEVSFTLDTSSLEGIPVVVFEDLYQNGELLTSHADITNPDQTVTFTNGDTPLPKTSGYDKTGNLLISYWWIALLVILTILGSLVIFAGKKREEKVITRRKKPSSYLR